MKLGLGLSLAGSAVNDARMSAETIRSMVNRGKFEIIDSSPGRFNDPQDGLRAGVHGAAAASKGYLSWRIISSAIK